MGPDEGGAVWPVFCVKNSRRKLQGRFGNPRWAFLSVKLYRCGTGTLPPSLAAAWQEVSGGRCGNLSTSLPFVINDGTVGMNVWFKFLTEDWAKHNSPQSAQGIVSGWTWWIYHRIWIYPRVDLPPDPVFLIELRHNAAEVNTPWVFFDSLAAPEKHSWFDWGGYAESPTGTSASEYDFETSGERLFSANFQNALKRRQIKVQYFTIQEAVAEVSGSWTAALFLGALLALGLQRIAPGLQREVGAPAPQLAPWVVLETRPREDEAPEEKDAVETVEGSAVSPPVGSTW